MYLWDRAHKYAVPGYSVHIIRVLANQQSRNAYLQDRAYKCAVPGHFGSIHLHSVLAWGSEWDSSDRSNIGTGRAWA